VGRTGARMLIVGIALTLGLPGVTGCGTDPVERMVRHQEAILTLIEANRDDEGTAAIALAAYVEEHAAELRSVHEDSQAIGEDPQLSLQLMRKHATRLAALEERRQRLPRAVQGLVAYDHIAELLTTAP